MNDNILENVTRQIVDRGCVQIHNGFGFLCLETSGMQEETLCESCLARMALEEAGKPVKDKYEIMECGHSKIHQKELPDEDAGGNFFMDVYCETCENNKLDEEAERAHENSV